MDPSSLRLKISGPLFSKILHERYKNSSNCGGLLYGQVVCGTKSEITDSQHVTTSESMLCVQDYCPLTNKTFFSHEKLWSTTEAWSPDLGPPKAQRVGFYRVRNSFNRLSLLEKSMHKKLCEDLQSGQRLRPSDFVVTLLITQGSNIHATCLSWRVNAYVWRESRFLPIKIEVLNLQGSVSSLYITKANPANVSFSDGTDAVLRSFQSSLSLDDDGAKLGVVEATRGVTQKLLSELDRAFEKLGRSEKALEDALQEKSALSAKLRSLRDKKESLEGLKDANLDNDRPIKLRKSQNQRVTMTEDDDDDPYTMSKNEYEYQVEKRRSLEDIKNRSPVVVLEMLDVVGKAGQRDTKMSIADAKPKVAESSSKDPFANLVLSVKEELKQDVADDRPAALNDGALGGCNP